MNPADANLLLTMRPGRPLDRRAWRAVYMGDGSVSALAAAWRVSEATVRAWARQDHARRIAQVRRG